jgi:multiple sugar transport system permease protein
MFFADAETGSNYGVADRRGDGAHRAARDRVPVARRRFIEGITMTGIK